MSAIKKSFIREVLNSVNDINSQEKYLTILTSYGYVVGTPLRKDNIEKENQLINTLGAFTSAYPKEYAAESNDGLLALKDVTIISDTEKNFSEFVIFIDEILGIRIGKP